MAKIIIDAENAIVGRMGSFVAKEVLKGNEVVILNSEKAVITGSKSIIMEKISNLRAKGGSSQKGPQISKLPERLLKRMIRGMLPWDRTRGREAWRRLKCYNSYDKVEEKNGKRFDVKIPNKYMTIKQITDLLE